MNRTIHVQSVCSEAALSGTGTTVTTYFVLVRLGPSGPMLLALAALLGLLGFALAAVLNYLLTIRSGRALPIVRALLDPPIAH